MAIDIQPYELILLLPDITLSDTGVYTCTAEKQDNQEIRTTSFDFTVGKKFFSDYILIL